MRNWTIKEAVEVINAGTDTEAIHEIAKHFPEFFITVVKNDLPGLTAMMGEKFTIRRLTVPQDVQEGEDSDDAPATPAAPANLEELSTKELMKLCDQRGLKVPHYGKNKQFYLDVLNGEAGDQPAEEAPAKPKRVPPTRKKKAEPEPEAEDDADEDPYAGMAAPDLYKECKSRGIKAAAKKPAKYYADLLRKADAEQEAGDDDDGGWGDEEDEAPAPKAKGGKAKPSKAKDDDDDGDWDI